MPTLTQVRDRVDSWLEARWPTLVSRQLTYGGNHGRYWQGLWTHVAPPEHSDAADGDTAPDNLPSSPTDQAESWLDFFAELTGVAIAAAMRVDVYDGPLGDGFVVTVRVRFNGTVYQRSRSHPTGGEDWRTVNWRAVDESGVTS